MADIQTATLKKKMMKIEETTGQKYNVRICYTQAAITSPSADANPTIRPYATP